MRDTVEFKHDTHYIKVISSPLKRGRIVSSGVGHFIGGTHFDGDSCCQECKFSVNEGTACTIRMSMQLRCERLLRGEDCCHTYDIIKNFPEPCKGGEKVKWVGDDGTWKSGVKNQKIFAILRSDGLVVSVPSDGLCHVFKKKE